MAAEPAFPWHLGVYDAHCHPTDTMASVPEMESMAARGLAAMATRGEDQGLVDGIAADTGSGSGVVPAFGWHPWFAHQMYDDAAGTPDAAEHYRRVLAPEPDAAFVAALPAPRPLSAFVADTERRLARHRHALVGEVGLDKAFRIPHAWLPGETRDASLTPGGREGRLLSPYGVAMDHQRAVLLAQLRLAGRLQRAVSVHGVQAHGQVYETLQSLWNGSRARGPSKKERRRKPAVGDAHNQEDSLPAQPPEYPPRICLHSYSGPPDMLKQYLNPKVPSAVFFSFSETINFSSSGPGPTKAAQVIMSLPADRILIESDLHTAGPRMDACLEAIARRVCQLRGWTLDDGVAQLGKNWHAFVYGDVEEVSEDSKTREDDKASEDGKTSKSG